MGRLQALGVVVVDFCAHISRDALKGRVNQHPPPRHIQNPEGKAVYSLPYPLYPIPSHCPDCPTVLVVVVPDEPVVVCAAVAVCSVVATAVVPAAVVPAAVVPTAPVVSEPNVRSIPTHSQHVRRIMLSIRHDISILNDLDAAVSNCRNGRWDHLGRYLVSSELRFSLFVSVKI